MAITKPTKEKTKSTSPDLKIPSLVDMLSAGVHFGHERSKKNPKMDGFVFMLRHRMAIIDLEKTHEYLTKAVTFLHELAKDPHKEILFVGTKRQSRAIIKRYAEAAGMPYVTQRWIGGMLTNFSTVLKSIEKLEELKSKIDTSAWDKITKKEKAVHMKEIERLEKVLEGTKSLKKPPAAILVVGSHDEKLAVKEAGRVNIPIVGVTDTNANPELVDYPIPANDDAIRSIDLIVSTLTRAIMSARGQNLDDVIVKEEPAAIAKPTEDTDQKPKPDNTEETKS